MRKKTINVNTENGLFVLLDRNERIVALSEDEMIMLVYVTQFGAYFGENGSRVHCERRPQEIEKLLITGDLLLLQPLGNFVFTSVEYSYYDGIFRQFYENYKSAVGEVLSFQTLMKLTVDEFETVQNTSNLLIEKLQSYSDFVDNMDITMVSQHILIKPYMAKYYYQEMSSIKERFSYNFGKEE